MNQLQSPAQYFTMYLFQVTRQAPLIQVHQSDSGRRHSMLHPLLVGKHLRSWKVRLKKAGTPSGTVTAKVRRNPGDSVVATFSETIDSTTLGTAFSDTRSHLPIHILFKPETGS